MKSPRRFCLITTFYPPYAFGGDAILVQQLAHLLADEGHHVEVVHCRDSFDVLRRGSGKIAHKPHPKVLVHTLGSPLGPLSPLLTHATGRPLGNLSRLKRILEQGFDVIHYHNVSLIGGPGLLQMGEALKLYTSHEYWLHCPTHLLLKWGREPCRTKDCARCCLSQSRPPQLWRYTSLLEKCCRHIDLFLYPTEFGRKMHEEAALPGPVEVLPNFVPDRHQTSEGRDGFLYVGRLEDEKGVKDLLPVFARLPEVHLTIIGKGTLAPTLAQACESLPNVELLGYLSPDELPQLMANSKAVLVPSKCYELLPLVILESFCQSTPVVVSAMGELPRIAQESGAGMVARTTQDWVEALSLLNNDTDLLASMSRRAREYYLRHNTPEIHLQTYLTMIEERFTQTVTLHRT